MLTSFSCLFILLFSRVLLILTDCRSSLKPSGLFMCQNNSVYPEDIKDILQCFAVDYARNWGVDSNLLENQSEIEFSRVYAYRGTFLGMKVVSDEIVPNEANFRLDCKERICYVENGNLIPLCDRRPEIYQKKIHGNIGLHDEIPPLYDGDEVIIFIGIPYGSLSEALGIINLTAREYTFIAEDALL